MLLFWLAMAQFVAWQTSLHTALLRLQQSRTPGFKLALSCYYQAQHPLVCYEGVLDPSV